MYGAWRVLAEHQVDDAVGVVVAELAEDRLRPVEPATGVEHRLDVVRVGVVDVPAGERLRELRHVVLAVILRARDHVIHAEREELHELAAVVLVGPALDVGLAVQEAQHRQGPSDMSSAMSRKETSGLVARSPYLRSSVFWFMKELRGRDRRARVGPVAMPEERHALHQRVARSHHAVDPAEYEIGVVARRIERLAVTRGVAADQRALGICRGENRPRRRAVCRSRRRGRRRSARSLHARTASTPSPATSTSASR